MSDTGSTGTAGGSGSAGGSPGVRTERDGPTLTITLDRPERLNALDPAMLDLAAGAVEGAAAAGARLVVLRGAGRAFCSGADLGVGGPTDEPVDPGTDTLEGANRLVRALRSAPLPTLAVVHGPAAGVGCSLALACDLQVVARSTYLLLAFARIGLMPDGGANALVPAAVGRARATRMAMLAERVPAHQAFDWGLVSHLADDDELESEVAALVATLSTGPTRAYAATKAALDLTSLDHLDDALAAESAGQAALLGSDDFAAGVEGFRARTTPEFRGG